MELLRKYILAGIVLLPSLVIAATDCWVIEYPDHYEAVCVGDEKSESVRAQAPVAAKAPVAAQEPVAAKAPVPSGVPAAQASLAVPFNSPVTAQPETARASDAIRQRMPDKSVSNATDAPKPRTNAKISFMTRLRENLVQRNMTRQ